jgi:predicted nucleic acid-binding protein
MEGNATAAWTATTTSGGFYLLLSSQEDAKSLVQKFSALGPAAKTEISIKTIPLGYTDAKYVALAESLGYVLPAKNRR